MFQEEKLEPLRNITDDPHIRLLNRLYARKRKELREREQLKVITCTSLVLDPFLFRFVLDLFLFVAVIYTSCHFMGHINCFFSPND